MSIKFKYLFLFVSLSFCQNIFAQGEGQSPYSVYGLGDLNDETVAAQDMMGGAGVSFSNAFYINTLNPALVVKGRYINGLKYVAFNFSGKGTFKRLEQGQNLGEDFDMNLSNITLAFPILPKWAIAVGFRPYSSVDNEVTVNKAFSGSSSIANYTYRDYGGLSKVNLTNSLILAKGLYAGIEAQYYFGNISRDTTTYFLGGNTYYDRYTGRTDLKGVSLKGGLAYQYKLNKKWYLNAGATYQLGSELKGDRLHIFQKMIDVGNGLIPESTAGPDTLSLTDFSTNLPKKFKIGLSLEKPFNWLIAAEYGITNWEGIDKPYDEISKKVLRNSTELNVGVEWVPNVASGRYFNQVFYRLGFKSVKTPYYLNNTEIMDNSFSFGFSLPLGKGSNYVDLGLALGRRGTIDNNLVQENYAKVSVSFSMLRDWFHRPRIQ